MYEVFFHLIGTNEKRFVEIELNCAPLQESRLKFYVPEKFWSSYRHFGQQINPREQQDAFEFFNQLVDQVQMLLSTFVITDKSMSCSTRLQGGPSARGLG